VSSAVSEDRSFQDAKSNTRQYATEDGRESKYLIWFVVQGSAYFLCRIREQRTENRGHNWSVYTHCDKSRKNRIGGRGHRWLCARNLRMQTCTLGCHLLSIHRSDICMQYSILIWNQRVDIYGIFSLVTWIRFHSIEGFKNMNKFLRRNFKRRF
jgi:hypothetical protein